jgi:hypothetical protein
MPDWGTVLGSGYDAFFDRKDKNREFQLRKQQEDALNTLRQIQIEDALKKQQIQAAVLAGQQGLKGQPTAEGLLKMGAIDNQSSDPRVMQQYGRGQIPQGYPEGMLTTPTLEQRYKQYAKDDPISGLPLMINYELKEAALEQKKELANMANKIKLQQIEAANKRAEDLLNFRKNNVRDSKPSADSKEPDANKEQIRLKRAMDMASAYLAKKYTYDNLTGEYLDNGSPVPRKKINQEYIDLVRQYGGKQTKSQAQPTTADPLGIR